MRILRTVLFAASVSLLNLAPSVAAKPVLEQAVWKLNKRNPSTAVYTYGDWAIVWTRVPAGYKACRVVGKRGKRVMVSVDRKLHKSFDDAEIAIQRDRYFQLQQRHGGSLF